MSNYFFWYRDSRRYSLQDDEYKKSITLVIISEIKRSEKNERSDIIINSRKGAKRLLTK